MSAVPAPVSRIDLTVEDPPAPKPWDGRWIETPDNWYRDVPPVRRWLFRDARRDKSPGVFPLGKAGQLVAEGGVGKTMMLVGLARCVASGSKFLNTFDCAEPGPVLMLLGEEDAEEAHRRIYNDARGAKPPPSGSIVVVPLAGMTCAMLECDASGNPMETAFVTWLRERVASRPWRLIIIDPQSRFAGLDAETDNALATRFVQLCESFLTPTCSVLVSHHTPQVTRGKGTTEAPRGRGVTALRDGFRWEAALTSAAPDIEDADDAERLSEVVTLQFTKSNYSKKPKPLLLRRDDHGALVPMDEDDIETVSRARNGTQKRAEARADANRERNRLDDEAVRELLASDPNMLARTLRAAVKAKRVCGSDRADDAIARVRGGQ